ncbi:MAG TPA: Flp pilus assembly protein CpaB [Noviherbaspirillum sp.]|nr:Flp pilus assembly protein CpaB [Noviherbaspirillum sp.]HJW55781.1 Flp pilus assembly protein CpaB [Burkholderiaceae bacterium]
MKINKTWAILGGALVVGAIAAFGAHRYIGNQLEEIEARDKNKRTIKIVVAKHDLQRGARLDTETIAVRTIPAEYAHSGAVLPEQFDRIEHQAIGYNVKAGEAIMWSQLEEKRPPSFSSRIAAGRRAMSVPVDEISSISGMLDPGDTIDLMVTVDRGGKKITFPIIQSVTVLAAGQRQLAGATAADRRGFTTITLDTTPEEARRIIVARETGKITALLRNPEDKNLIANSMDDLSGLFGGSESGIEIGVPVIYGGRGKLPGDIPRLGAPVESSSAPIALQPPASITPGIVASASSKAQQP